MYKFEDIFSIVCKALASTFTICGLAGLGFIAAMVVYEVWLRSSVAAAIVGCFAVFACLFLVMCGVGAMRLIWTGQITPSS